MIELSVVIPVYASANCLEELLERIRQSLAAIPFEVILVNDRSPDASWEVIQRLARSQPQVVGINLRRNFGQDSAIMAGLHQAQGRYVAVMDDDLQHPPEELPRLLAQCRKGFDVCYAHFLHRRQKRWKTLGSHLNGWMAEFFLNKPKGIYISPFKVIHHEVVEAIGHYTGPYPYVDGLILSCTDNLCQIEVPSSGQEGRPSNYSLFKSISVWLRHVTGFSVIPLRLATVAGSLSAMAGFMLGLTYIYLYFAEPESYRRAEGWTSIVSLLLFLGGLTLMVLGIIGEYVGRAYLAINQKPQFVIKETIRHRPLVQPQPARPTPPLAETDQTP